ncbi:enoyl-CoA hydratase-related protein [Brevundimonas sp.]|uniref:enoyl-CoA hydratase-related protein n=1 Tax=Brevundimonas sp. TaxID=1871086 RepID=UPI001A34C858|nr:enoyl-CoA hydratase-related protein [Brevundimonas sp.]MBJ7483896.1 enoyl-CoA hydratase/isomerase family protein [Brevundimonas sp.]
MTDPVPSADECLNYSVDQGVALIELNRPARLNAFNADLYEAADRAFIRAGLDDDVRVVVLTGAGRGFCAGADVERLGDLSSTGGSTYKRRGPDDRDPKFDALDIPQPETANGLVIPIALRKPVIAAVNGAAAGMGLLLACACDIRFAAQSAVFLAGFTQRGLVAEYGLAWLLPRIVGMNAASDILLSGRRIDAQEAREINLITRVIPDETFREEVIAYARKMAATASPRSTRLIKQQLWTGQHASFGDSAREAHALLIDSFSSADFAEALLSAKEKRSPCFTGD